MAFFRGIKKDAFWLNLVPGWLGFTVLVILMSDHPFFWDTVLLASRHAHFFYDNGFASLLVPDAMDCGHIPFFGAYLALIWKVFGKTLFVSHFAMLPFLWGLVYQLFVLARRFFSPAVLPLVMVLLLVDPALLGQAALVSPDIPLLFCLLLGFNAVLDNRRWVLSVAILGLFMVSMRGMLLSLGVLALDLVVNFHVKQRSGLWSRLMRMALAYGPALLLFILYQGVHYESKGWIAYHANSGWSGNFRRVGLSGMLYNAGILGWRLVDHGRLFIWLLVPLAFWKVFRRSDIQGRRIFLLAGLCLAPLLGPWLLYQSMSCHRYLIPVYLLGAMAVLWYVMETWENGLRKTLVYLVLLGGLFSGHFWIYPEKISQGWDSSLAQAFYFRVRTQMMGFIRQESIPLHTIGSAFPNLGPQENMDLGGDTAAFADKDRPRLPYILYSNVFNDFRDGEIDSLPIRYDLVREYRQAGVFMRLYRLKEQEGALL